MRGEHGTAGRVASAHTAPALGHWGGQLELTGPQSSWALPACPLSRHAGPWPGGHPLCPVTSGPVCDQSPFPEPPPTPWGPPVAGCAGWQNRARLCAVSRPPCPPSRLTSRLSEMVSSHCNCVNSSFGSLRLRKLSAVYAGPPKPHTYSQKCKLQAGRIIGAHWAGGSPAPRCT